MYVGGNDAVGVWEVANVLEFDEDNPLIEYDLLEVRDGRIAAWTLYYHPETMPAFAQPPGQPEAEAALLANYATAWSSNDTAAVAGLYAAEASHDEPVTGAIFAVRPAGDEGSCEVRMAVLLQTNDAEEIVGERAYYDVDSLIDCDWAE